MKDLYEVLYTVEAESYPWVFLPLLVPSFAAIFAGVTGVRQRRKVKKFAEVAPWIVAGLLVGGGPALWIPTYFFYNHWEAKQSLIEGRCRILTGRVENYESTERREKFSIGGVRFDYSRWHPTAGLGRDGFQSPLRNGMPVRICYQPAHDGLGGAILKVEIDRSPE